MASTVQVCVSCELLLLLTALPGVRSDDDYTIGGLVAAAGVSFIFLAVVIAMIIVGFTWNSWYPAMQRAKGKVKMPRDYWKKREEAKLRLLNGSTTRLTSLAAPSEHGLPNGKPPTRVQDTVSEDDRSERASWIQGWTNASMLEGQEEMTLAMNLGAEAEEGDEEFRIETIVVDNEPLDLGPFRDSDVPNQPTTSATSSAGPASTSTGVLTGGNARTSQQTATLEMTEDGDDEDDDDEGYLYSTVDRSRQTSARSDSNVDPMPTSEAVTSFSKLDPSLVAF
ncbi:uncharacterized protein [Littorina saxatilis]|uniref:Uncharacterized protein n=2 Tax=Littorina saxatilis TaxID=31220 RepID=A0AAN9GM31_9CAEN